METDTTTIQVFRDTIASYRQMIDKTINQLDDEEFFQRPAKDINSVAIILRHLGGNLESRWTDFLTTDGEKPTRDRDAEFADWSGTRIELMNYFDAGWERLVSALNEIQDSTLTKTIYIRGEAHSVLQAITRSITHLTYHVGQISLVSRLVHKGDWNWLTIKPNQSGQFNEQTWGTSKSRAVFSESAEDQS